LPATPAAQLAVDSGGIVYFGENHMQTAQIGDPLAQLDVGATACHVR
jgi:hypothetical protein